MNVINRVTEDGTSLLGDKWKVIFFPRILRFF